MQDTLVTTALRDTWPRSGRAIFLGEWCWGSTVPTLNDPPSSIEGLSAWTVPYHWDDRNRFAKDVAYLDSLVARVRKCLSEALNDYHGTDHSQRFWDLFAGWWALYFTHIYWDRWEVIRDAVQRFPDVPIVRRGPTDAPFAPQERGEFLHAFQDDPWNERLFADIAQEYFDVKLREVSTVDSFGFEPNAPSHGAPIAEVSLQGRLRGLLRRASTAGPLRRQTVSLTSDYLSAMGRTRLDLALHQPPQSRALPMYAGVRIEPTQRTLDLDVGNTDFEVALARTLVKTMPVAYLEGFASYMEALDDLRLPIHPKLVVTATGHYASDLYSLWAAKATERGASLLVLQHGGSYGIARHNSALSHDKQVADRFISWGWRDSQVTPAPANKLLDIRHTKTDGNGPLVLTLNDLCRYSHWLASQPMPSQQLGVVRFVFRFLAQLDGAILGETTARVLQAHNGWQVPERLREQFPLIKFADDAVGYVDTIRGARMVVCTDNSTTMIEALAAGTPTLILWDSAMNELSRSGNEAMEHLRDAHIFFDDPIEAANHVNAIWEDVHDWWSSPEVSQAVDHFLSEYGQVGDDPYRTLASVIRSFIPTDGP